MVRMLVCGICVLALGTGFSPAQDEKPGKPKDKIPRPVGTWVRELGNNNKVTFEIRPARLRFLLQIDGEKISVDADYGVTKDGYLFGRINKVDSTRGDGPEAGQLFCLKWQKKEDTLTISELTGTHTNEDARRLVEGEYRQVGNLDKKKE